MQPIANERILDARGLAVSSQPQPEVPVRNVGEAQIESPHSLENRRSHDDIGGTRRHRVVATQRDDHLVRQERWRTVLHNELGIHVQTTGVGPLSASHAGRFELPPEFVRAPQVVVITESDPFCGRS